MISGLSMEMINLKEQMKIRRCTFFPMLQQMILRESSLGSPPNLPWKCSSEQCPAAKHTRETQLNLITEGWRNIKVPSFSLGQEFPLHETLTFNDKEKKMNELIQPSEVSEIGADHVTRSRQLITSSVHVSCLHHPITLSHNTSSLDTSPSFTMTLAPAEDSLCRLPGRLV